MCSMLFLVNRAETKEEGGICVRITTESALYIDIQAAVPAGRCPVCGREVYFPAFHCISCERAGT